MMSAVKVEDTYCWECDADEIYMDLKEEPGVYKVGAICHDCDYDYGVLSRLSRSDVDHMDEAWDQAKKVVRGYME